MRSSFRLVVAFRRALLAVVVAGLLVPGVALATDSLTLTPADPTADGVPMTVKYQGYADTAGGEVDVFRVTSQPNCPDLNGAYANGHQLDFHTNLPQGSFNYEHPNGGTQTAGASYMLCGYLLTNSGQTITIAKTSSYTVPGGGPPSPPPGSGPPTVVTGEPDGPSGEINTLTGTVTSNGYDTTYRFVYGPTTDYGQHLNEVIVSGARTSPAYVYERNPVPAGTTFHYRLEATNSAGTTYGEDRIATTPGGVPTATTGSATDVTTDGFTLHGTYNPHGSALASFEFTTDTSGTGASGGTASKGPVAAKDAGSENEIHMAVPAGFDEFQEFRWPGMGAFSGGPVFPGEKATLTIHYRLVVGNTTGDWKTVTSAKAARLPTATTGGAKGIHCAEGPCVELTGTVNDNSQGYSLPAFEVGPTKSYGTVCPVYYGAPRDANGDLPPSSSEPYQVTRYSCGRYPAPGGTLHYRLVASNGGKEGTAVGEDRTYTAPGPSPLGPSALNPSGPAAKIAAILKAGAYPALVAAPGAGKAQIVWSYIPGGGKAARAAKSKSVLVASGAKRFTKKGKGTLKVKLTARGKALLRKVGKGHTLKLTATGSFTRKGGKKTSSTKVFSLKR
jgi:hypothetical protein